MRTILLFLVDQLGARWIEAAGDGVVDLPNLRRLQEHGTTFTRAYTQSPVCSPARASLATGLSVSAHGVLDTGYRLDPSVPTVMHALRQAGWRTGGFGKLHFVPQLEDLDPDYRAYGFDAVAATEDARVGMWLDWVERTHPEWFTAALSTVWMTMAPGLDAYGPERRDLRAEIESAHRAFPASTTEYYELPFPEEVSQTAWITDRAIDFLSTIGNEDAFLHVSYVQPHNPSSPPHDYLLAVDATRIPTPIDPTLGTEDVHYFDRNGTEPRTAADDWRAHRQHYFADIAHLDHQLGRLLDQLDECGRTEESLVIYTSDHGDLLHDHGFVGKWERHYDANVRVPLVVSGHGFGQAERGDLVTHTDVAATILDWADSPAPTLPYHRRSGVGNGPMLHGRSLLAPTRRDDVLIQSNGNSQDVSLASWARSVVTDRYRYTRFLDDGGEQLFDLHDDPDEVHNLVNGDASTALLDEMRRRLLDALVEDGSPPSPRSLFRIGGW